VNRAEQLRRAIRQANMPNSAVVMFDTIVGRCDWAAGTLPDAYQPRSLAELSRWAGIPERSATAALELLERFGWVERERPRVLRRGLSTTYQPKMGGARPRRERRPVSDAERAKHYRERQRGKFPVTHEARHETTAAIDRHEETAVNVTQKLPRSSRQESVTNAQASGQIAQWAVVGAVGGEAFQDHEPPTDLQPGGIPERRLTPAGVCGWCGHDEPNGYGSCQRCIGAYENRDRYLPAASSSGSPW
jgi:hypothetical protein